MGLHSRIHLAHVFGEEFFYGKLSLHLVVWDLVMVFLLVRLWESQFWVVSPCRVVCVCARVVLGILVGMLLLGLILEVPVVVYKGNLFC